MAVGTLETEEARAAPGPRSLSAVKTLHVINGEDYSGAERVQDLLALSLPEFGYEVAFACVKPGMYRQACQAKDCQFFDLPMRRRVDLRPVRSMAKIIREEGFALVHTHSVRAAMIARPASLWAGVPMVHHMHLQTSTDHASKLRGWTHAMVERVSLSGVRAVIAVSGSMGDYIHKLGVPRNRIVEIINGVPAPTTRAATLYPHHGTCVVGTVAMFRPRKGIESLIDAVKLLNQRGHSVRLRAVGRFQTPEYEASVKAYALAQGADSFIDWVGFTTDVHAELAKMHFFVLPSILAEGLPMAMIEAMAAGVPVLGSRVAGIVETITDGVDGIVFAPGDAGDMAEKLRGMIQGTVDLERLRDEALARHESRYSVRTMAERVAQVYQRILC